MKSVFSQLPTEPNNNNSSVPPKPKDALKTAPRRSTRSSKSVTNDKPPPPIAEVVNLDDSDEDSEQQLQQENTNQQMLVSLTSNGNWIDLFSPKKTEELAIHPKKIQELEQFFKHCEVMKKKKRPAQLCLLTGPSGCGKTAAVQVNNQ